MSSVESAESPFPQIPQAVTHPAANITDNEADVSGTVIPNGLETNACVEWGLTTAYGALTTPFTVGADDSAHDVLARLQGLLPATAYHFRVVAENSAGTSSGMDETFVTRPSVWLFERPETQSVLAALAKGDNVAIFGPAGSGKSALALQVASAAATNYSGGVLVVSVRDRRPPEVAAELVGEPTQDALERLRERLQREPSLLILEDVESMASVEPLLPSSGAVSRALILSRRPVGRAKAGRVAQVELGPLATEQVRIVLAGAADADGASEPINALVRFVGGNAEVLSVLADVLANGVEISELATQATNLLSVVVPESSGDRIRRHENNNTPKVIASLATASLEQRHLVGAAALLDDGFTTADAIFVAGSGTEGALQWFEDDWIPYLASLNEARTSGDGYALTDMTRAVARDAVSNVLDPRERALFVVRALAQIHGGRAVGSAPPTLAGFLADTPAIHDSLGFMPDVEGLSAVITTKEVEPPISIGLFGDWGTGKSTFMRLMRDEIRRIERQWRDQPDSPFCTNVKQIVFNAWNYSDANVWAGLVTRIFEGLAKPDPEVTDDRELSEKELAAVAAALETTSEKIAQKQVEQDNAEQRTARLEEQLADIQKREQEQAVKLAQFRPRDLGELLDDPEAHELAESLGQTFGVPTDEAITLARDLRTSWGRLASVWRLGHWRALAVVLVAAAFAAAADLIANHGFPALGVVGSILGWVAAAIPLLGPPVRRVRDAAATADELLARVKEQQAAEIRQEKTIVQLELDRLANQRAQVDRELAEAREQARRAEQEIDDIRSGRRITRFVEDRAASADYSPYLGLIALIRRDLEQLRRLLRESQAAERPQIDRIVLYIDDLDRCPAAVVVQVLEAVHLLLAIDLFVVVVGVDPRWLFRSLTWHYANQFGSDGSNPSQEGPEAWTTTPQNYLEKIFQIPLAIPQMQSEGFKALMSTLLEVRPTEQQSGEQPDDEISDNASETTDTGESTAIASAAAQQTAPPTVELQLERLQIWPGELEFLHTLAPLVSTPRAAKRLSNTYRLIRATLSARELARFVSKEGASGDYQAVLLLLAVMIGFPTVADDVFRALATATDPSLVKLVERLKNYSRPTPTDDGAAAATEGDGWTGSPDCIELTRLHTALNGVETTPGPRGIRTYQAWAARVGRYSFETARALAPVAAGATHQPDDVT